MANPPKHHQWVSHPLVEGTILQQISASPPAEGCCVPRLMSPISPWAGLESKQALNEFFKECVNKWVGYYDKDMICEGCEIVWENSGYDGEALLK